MTATPSEPPKVRRNTQELPGSADVDAEVAGDAREPGAVALADRPELPLVAVAVDLAEDHRGLVRRILGQVVTRELTVVGLVHHPDERVADLPEVLAT